MSRIACGCPDRGSLLVWTGILISLGSGEDAWHFGSLEEVPSYASINGKILLQGMPLSFVLAEVAVCMGPCGDFNRKRVFLGVLVT